MELSMGNDGVILLDFPQHFTPTELAQIYG